MIAALKGRSAAHLFRKVKDFKKGLFKSDAYVSRCGLAVVSAAYLKDHPDELEKRPEVNCSHCNRLISKAPPY